MGDYSVSFVKQTTLISAAGNHFEMTG